MNAILLCALTLLGLSSASHFRYGTIQWTPMGANSVQFRVFTAWKRSYWAGSGIDGDGKVKTGDEFEVPAGRKGNNWYFEKSDPPNQTKLLQVLVTAPADPSDINYSLDQAMGISEDVHTYASPTNAALGQPWMAGFFGCCRLTGRPDGDPFGEQADGLNNNGFGNWDVMTRVDLSSGPSGQDFSPLAVGKPILRLRMDYAEVFDIVAVDADDDLMTWRLGDESEMGGSGNKQPGFGANLIRSNYPGGGGGSPITDLNKIQMHNVQEITDTGDFITFGEAHWNTNGLQTGYWQATIMINGGKADIPYDYLMLLRDPKSNSPPYWIDPTPQTTNELKVECGDKLEYTMRADDDQDGGGEATFLDEIEMFLINMPPTGMVHGSGGQAGEPNGIGPNGRANPVEWVSTWYPPCANKGKTVVCYQAMDTNIQVNLDSRVRCVIIRVIEVVRSPPVYVDPTPENNKAIGVCVGKDVSFEVCVSDPDGDAVDVVVLSGKPPKMIVSDLVTTAGTASKGCRSFSWLADYDATETTVCFEGTEIAEGEGANPLKTERRCVQLSVRFPPVFIGDILPEVITEGVPATEGSPGSPSKHVPCAAYTAYLNEELALTVVAKDDNAEDDVSIFVVSDLPENAAMGPNTCPDGVTEGAAPCNPVSRTMLWTPQRGQEGQEYRFDWSSRDNKDTCQVGGYYSILNACAIVKVIAPNPTWLDPTPAEAHHFISYVGCVTSFELRGDDLIDNEGQIIHHYPVEIDVDGEAPLPTYATLSPLRRTPIGGEGGYSTMGVRYFNWKPRRGQEAFAYETCFFLSDVGRLSVLKRCVTMEVIRCKYCINHGDSLLSVAADYDLDWIQLWGSNVDVKNPDHMYNDQLINLCPSYYVKAHDTMDMLAERFGTTPAHILSMNPDLADENDVNVGQEVCVCPNVCSDVASRWNSGEPMTQAKHDFPVGQTVRLSAAKEIADP